MTAIFANLGNFARNYSKTVIYTYVHFSCVKLPQWETKVEEIMQNNISQSKKLPILNPGS